MEAAWIFQINLSRGGVPKFPVHRAHVAASGLAGDEHHDLKAHGGPERALCLYSLEQIKVLQAEGHPIFPGSTGENLVLTGLDWSLVTPNVRLRLGAAVVIEMTRYTTPCSKIASSFVDGQILRLSQDHAPGWARLYARVLSPGDIQVGDRVRINS